MTTRDGNTLTVPPMSGSPISATAHEEVAKAIYEQYLTLGNCYGMFYNPVRARLAERLISLSPPRLKRVFFCNSGAEAVEGALKFARASTGKGEIIAAMRGFHGKTFGALAATWGEEYQKPFAPMMPGMKHVPFNNFQKLSEAVSEETAAIILELVQGEGGVRVGDKAYFEQVRELCDQKGILLILDEVQTGFGRTGTLFACEQFVEPDHALRGQIARRGHPHGRGALLGCSQGSREEPHFHLRGEPACVCGCPGLPGDHRA